MTERRIEEMLEYIWASKERFGAVERVKLNEKFGDEPASNLLDKMSHKGYIETYNGTISLTEHGTRHAELVIRRHRLAERLLHDVLDYSSSEYESSACQFEHYVGNDVVNSICILLGHPKTCPHGMVIPRGDCCLKAMKEISSLILPLTSMKTGDIGKVIYITTKFHHRLDRISGIGIMPGVQIKVLQRVPTYVVQLGESQVALDHNISSSIFLCRKNE